MKEEQEIFLIYEQHFDQHPNDTGDQDILGIQFRLEKYPNEASADDELFRRVLQ